MRFNLSYQKFDFKDALTAGTNGDSQIFGSTGGFSVDLIRGPVRPYITAGVGAFNVQTSFDGAASSRDVSSTKFGIDGGAGLAVQIGRIDAFLEARLQNVYTERGLIDQKTIQVIPITVGIVF
ncbi:MAG: outer membrane beta-barrel protein [Gemmatimonadaceae bacterium]|nr:outer membrane beta-barrel protein [Gemmatimonadaceae bacterium]